LVTNPGVSPLRISNWETAEIRILTILVGMLKFKRTVVHFGIAGAEAASDTPSFIVL
jgi:hypothetical protein